MSLTHEDALEISDRMRTSFKIQNAVGFGDMNIKAPDIDIFPDEQEYFSSADNMIHIGAFGPIELFGVESEEEYVNALSYLRGHEEQHCRSTADTPYAWGIERSCEVVLEYIAAHVEKSKRRFRSKSDYADYADRVLPQKGIYISYQMLRNIMASITNSVEDGRIERIRAAKFPGFQKQRMVFRGKYWDKAECDFKPYKDIEKDTMTKLGIIANQILLLATCQLYQRGFVLAYTGTPLMDEVQALMPHIAKGVMAGRTRGMAEQVIEIAKKLAPYLYEVCKLSDKEVKTREALKKMIQDLLKAAVDQMSEFNLSEMNEEQGEGISSVFEHSDLVITLDDETYDKLTENAKQRGGDGSGIMIRREHPKEEEKKDESSDNESSGGSGSGSKNDENGEDKKDERGKGSAKSSDKEKGEKNEHGKNDSGNTENETAASDTESRHEKAAGEKESGDVQDAGNSDDSGECGEQESSGKLNGSAQKLHESKARVKGKTLESKKSASVEEMILRQMEQAAEETNEKAKEEVGNINAAKAHERSMRGKETPNADKPITPEQVKDICPQFSEFTRKYKLTERLPAVVNARGKALLRKNQMYFKSLSTPNVTYLDSGSIDPARIYGLSFGDTQIFRKKGMDRKFDGCAYILMDNSGSMAGKKRTEACKAAAVIEESFRGLIPIKITAFDYNGVVTHEVVKGWDENMHLNCSWNFCLQGRTGGGNADGYSIQIAARELMKRPEKKKMLIVLSDGMPTGTSEGYTKEAIRAARKMGISVHGIYFEEGSIRPDSARKFAGMYERDYICCPVTEVDANLSAIMKKFSRS